MAGAGAPNEVGIVLKVRGLPEAQRDLDSLVARVNKGADQVQSDGQRRQAQANQQSGGASGQGGSGQPGGATSGMIAGGAFIGSLAAQMAQRSFSALSQGLAQSFDPNMTEFEKELGMRKAGAQAIPFVGDLASARLSAINQVGLGTAQGTSSQLNQIFGPAARAIGLANPNMEESELRKLLETKLGPMIEKLANTLAGGERGRELGSQVVADTVSKVMKDLGLDVKLDAPNKGPLDAIADTVNDTIVDEVGKLVSVMGDVVSLLTNTAQTTAEMMGVISRIESTISSFGR